MTARRPSGLVQAVVDAARRRLRLRDESGVSLVEVLIASSAMVLVLAPLYGLLSSASRLEAGTTDRADKTNEMRVGLDRLTKDLRQALSIDTSSTTSKVVMTTLVSGAETTVQYELSAGTLTRKVGAGQARTLVTDVTVATPFCYDPPDCAGASPASSTISLIRVKLVASPATGAEPINLTTWVQLRNTRA